MTPPPQRAAHQNRRRHCWWRRRGTCVASAQSAGPSPQDTLHGQGGWVGGVAGGSRPTTHSGPECMLLSTTQPCASWHKPSAFSRPCLQHSVQIGPTTACMATYTPPNTLTQAIRPDSDGDAGVGLEGGASTGCALGGRKVPLRGSLGLGCFRCRVLAVGAMGGSACHDRPGLVRGG